MRILLTDDDSFLRDMYATKFSELGHEVDSAETGEIAIVKLREKQFDMVLTDMIMPGMNGVDLIRQIKKEGIGGNPVCFVLSNQSEEHDKSEAMNAGAAGYIVKAEKIPSEVVTEVINFMTQNHGS